MSTFLKTVTRLTELEEEAKRLYGGKLGDSTLERINRLQRAADQADQNEDQMIPVPRHRSGDIPGREEIAFYRRREKKPLTLTTAVGIVGSRGGLDHLRNAYNIWFKNGKYNKLAAFLHTDFPIPGLQRDPHPGWLNPMSGETGPMRLANWVVGQVNPNKRNFVRKTANDSRMAFLQMSKAIEIVLRQRSGAAVPKHEVNNYFKWYLPDGYRDNEQVARAKVHALMNHFQLTNELLTHGRNLKPRYVEGKGEFDNYRRDNEYVNTPKYSLQIYGAPMTAKVFDELDRDSLDDGNMLSAEAQMRLNIGNDIGKAMRELSDIEIANKLPPGTLLDKMGQEKKNQLHQRIHALGGTSS